MIAAKSEILRKAMDVCHSFRRSRRYFALYLNMLSPSTLSNLGRFCCALGILTLLSVCVIGQTRSSRPQSSPKQKPNAKESSIHGRVVYSDTGRPLRRGVVFLISADDGEWGEQHSVTNRVGNFAITKVGPGRYFVVVIAPDIASPVNQIDPNASLSEKAALGQIEDGFSEVTVDGRSSVKTDIRVTRGGVITGRVLSEDDVPIASARIKLFQSRDGRFQTVTTWRPPEGRNRVFETDSRGVYRIAGLAGGEYIVRASESNLGGNADGAMEGSYADGSMLVAYHPKALQIQEATSVKVQEGAETKEVDIRLPDRGLHRVSGTVVLRGSPGEGAEVRLNRYEPEENQFRFDSVQARTDEAGKWEIRAVPDGVYRLTISGFLVSRVGSDGQRLHLSAAPERREVVVAGSDVTNFNVEVVPGGEVRGVVSVEGGASLPDRVTVVLVPTPVAKTATPGTAPADQSPLGSDNEGAVRGFMRSKGEFAISELPSGLFQIRMDGLGTKLYVKAVTLDGKDLLRNPIKVESGKYVSGIRILLATDVVALSGRAVEKKGSNKPLTDGAVLLFPVDPVQRRLITEPLIGRTDKEGRFVVKGAPGEYFVFVLDRRRKDKLARPTEETMTSNSSKLQKVRLQRGNEKTIVEVFKTE